MLSTQLIDRDSDFIEFARRLKMRTGLDLLSYKQEQVRRRLGHFCQRKGYATFSDLYKDLVSRSEAYEALMDQLTINVTEFYRNPERWQFLQRVIFPDILERTTRVKCWSAACSTGDEAYSLVLALSSVAGLHNVTVHATDIDSSVLKRAQAGRYAGDAVKGVPASHLATYFHRSDDEYVISDEIKKRVQFRQHDLLSDMFPKDYDLISCRNVLIYFTDKTKDMLYGKFAQSLKRGGYLFVGGAEQVSDPAKFGLELVEPFFYRKD